MQSNPLLFNQVWNWAQWLFIT